MLRQSPHYTAMFGQNSGSFGIMKPVIVPFGNNFNDAAYISSGKLAALVTMHEWSASAAFLAGLLLP